MNDTAERWLPIPGHEGRYEVSDLGRVRSMARTVPSVLKSTPNGGDYARVSLWRDGRRTHGRVHALVLLAFVGPRPEGMEVRHRDGDHLNSVLANLAYGTHSENEQDRVQHGTHHNARKTHCPQGHEFTAANTYTWRTSRSCRACKRIARDRYLATRAA